MERHEQTPKKVAGNTSTTSRVESERTAIPGHGSPDCPHCHGLGFVSADAKIEDGEFGRLYACSCRLDDLQQQMKVQRQQYSSLGPLTKKTFENFLPEGHAHEQRQRDSLKRAYEQACSFAEQPKGWVLIHGGYGCGKTHLAAAIANHCLLQDTDVLFVNTPDLLDHLRATFGPGSPVGYDDLFEQTRNAPLLILDDLGAENPTQWAQEKLYQIINHRYNGAMPTVITCNVELERIEPRVRSRLVDIDLVRKFIIDAPDFRRAESDQTNISSLAMHARQTFDTFNLRVGEIASEHQQRLRTAAQAAQKYAEQPEGWLILTGGHGCGKTHLAAAIANQRIRSGHPSLFITVADLLDHLRATFSPDSLVRFDKQFSELRNAPLLLLDDLAMQSATPWAHEKLTQLIDHRYLARLPTVVTTAADKSELGTRLESRLLDPQLSIICPITAPMYRGSKQKPGRRTQ